MKEIKILQKCVNHKKTKLVEETKRTNELKKQHEEMVIKRKKESLYVKRPAKPSEENKERDRSAYDVTIDEIDHSQSII